MIFTNEFLIALGNWQRGWGEIQSVRERLADELERASADLPVEFRSVKGPCYRKHFLVKGELTDIVLRDVQHYGLMSWTLDIRFAEQFKGMMRDGAVSAAIFQHQPTAEEVIVDVTSLWQCEAFQTAVSALAEIKHSAAEALINFKDKQSEVVIKAPLRGSEIVALVGVSSPFDDLCDTKGIPEAERDRIFRSLMADGIYTGAPIYLSLQGAQNAISRTIQRMLAKIEESKSWKPYA